ncbi:hypothetical protein AAHA92_33984 [Salvia divinorum]|uniref:Integrase catalytic domain-containing protein n=1 Tax=Salvia divinorum TaxID=28513 RepID=A0ABD1FHF6_SALDI
MPQMPIIVCEVFDIEAKETNTCESKEVAKFLKANIFSRYGIPRAIISDQGTHFCNRTMEALMQSMESTISYPPHITPNQMVRRRSQIERAYWAIKEVNLKADACEDERKLQLQELEELRLESYDSAMWYKERTKLWHDKNLRRKELQVGQRVLLFQSRLKLMPGKLKSKWIGPFTIVALRANGAVELKGSDSNSSSFLVNDHRVKGFRDSSELCVVEEISLRMPALSSN